jgi:hypothetical protein
MRIDSAGNVGIGTSSPGGKFDVLGAVSATPVTNGVIRIVTTGSNPATGSGGGLLFAQQNSAGSYENYASITSSRVNQSANNKVDLVFSTGDPTGSTAIAERMRIDTSGNLLVGTTSTNSAAAGFRAFGSNQTQMAKSGDWALRMGRRDSSGIISEIYYNDSRVGDITTNGSNTTYNSASDYRLKENIEPMQNALAAVLQLKPVTYKWKVDGAAGQGFIAHELQEVVSECVRGEKNEVDAEGLPVYQSIDTSVLVATLTAAIQEQQALITSLTARLDAANL